MNREYYRSYSANLEREMELLIFGHSGEAVIFFPTRTAHFYDYENWRIIESMRDKIECGLLQVFCVDSFDAESFYASIIPEDKIAKHLQYEQYILNDVLPLVKKKNNSSYLIAAGCSLGGYHAVNIALKHPDKFNKVVGMSARYDLTLSSVAFPDLFNGFVDENVYFNMPSMYLPNLSDDEVLDKIRKLSIYIIIGKEDPFYENNYQLSGVLSEKKVPHHFFVWEEEAHRPRYWRQMVKHYL